MNRPWDRVYIRDYAPLNRNRPAGAGVNRRKPYVNRVVLLPARGYAGLTSLSERPYPHSALAYKFLFFFCK